MVAFGGGIDDGGAVHVGGDDGTGDFSDEAGFVDLRAVEDPSVEVGGCFAFVDVLDEVGERDALGFVAVFPFNVDGEAVGTGSLGFGVFVFVGALFLGIEFIENAEGGGLVVGEKKRELDLNGADGGLQDGLVDFLAGFVAEGVFDGKFLVQDAAGDAHLACGGGDLNAVEVKDTGGDLFDELLGVFKLLRGIGLGSGGVLGRCAWEGCEE